MPIMKRISLTLVAGLLFLTGCFSLGRNEPVQQHFVLGGNGQQTSHALAERLAGVSLGLRQVKMVGYLNSPLIIVRHGAHELRFSEFNRWGEDLGSGVVRAVAAGLAGRAAFEGIDVVPWAVRARHDFIIQLHLLHFEGLVPEEAATEGGASVLVQWEVIRQLDGMVLARGTTDYRARGWQVGDYGALVTLFESGLNELSDDLIAGLERASAAAL
jgi:uncharacterized lipoprotein YmbA